MGDDRKRDEARPGDPAEGVRIIGAEEAAEAIERGDVAERRGDRLPRYGDRPARPPVGPKPALRFPLEGSADPAEAASVRPAKGVRFDPRPAPAWDEPAVEDTDDDPWPSEDTWGVPARGGWDEPHDDVVAWTQGQTGSQPAARDTPAEEQELSWAEGFVDDEEGPWDGSWDEPTGAISWADVKAPVGDVAAGEATSDPTPEPTADDQWAAFGDEDEDDDSGGSRRKGRRIFARRDTTDADPEEPSVGQDPTPADPTPAADIDLTEAAADATDEGTDLDAGAWGPPSEEVDSVDAPDVDAPDVLPGSDQLRSEVSEPDELDDAEPAERGPLFDDAGGWADSPAKVFDFADEPSGQVELPHWTDPPTGELPRVLAGDDAGPAPTTTGSTPAVSWQGHDGRWGNEGFDDLIEDDGAARGALDDARPHHDDAFDFEEPEPQDEEVPPPPPRDHHRVPPARPEPDAAAPSTGAGRNLGMAVGVGAAVAAVALAALWIGSAATLVLVIAILVVCLIEYQKAIRRAGYRPSALLGIAAAVLIPLAVYWKGIEAYPLLAVMTVVTALAWHLAGADGDSRVVESVGVTLLGVGWVVGLGSFAALMLSLPDGRGMLFTAIIAAVAYDVGGYAIGRSMGTRAFSDASPNKTVEGLLGGMVVSIVVVVIVIGFFGVQPFDGPSAALKIALFAALAAPLGDLCESLIKRDLGVKDMGSVLPEHGGLLDRFDALLFVLPAVYYGAVFFSLGPLG